MDHRKQLQDKVILITGSLGAAGRAATSVFLERGAKIAACDILDVSAFTEREALEQQYGADRLLYIQADASDEAQVIAMIAQIEQYFGTLDGLYHNAYVNLTGRIADLSLDAWDATIKGTLTSAFLTGKYAAELMGRTGGGSIVNTSSILGFKGKPQNSAYGAGKAGLEQFTRIMAVEFAEQRIRANAIVPGDFKSDAVIERLTDNHLKWMKNDSLIGRSGRAHEINEVAAFLLSDAASYVTGSMYPVNGGLWI